jgi:uncharacterized ubiquitin-like protein YukD
MIDRIYIDRAISLRKDYLNLNKSLNNYNTLIINLKNKVEYTIKNLQDIIDNSKNISSEDIQKRSIEYLRSLEDETQKIQRFIDPINKKLKSLQKEEQALYDQIKTNYPGIEDKEILSFIQDELKKANLS